MGVTLRP